MMNDIAITDDMKAVSRWENEGGKVTPFNSVWTSLKSFKTEGSSLEKRVIDTQKAVAEQRPVIR